MSKNKDEKMSVPPLHCALDDGWPDEYKKYRVQGLDEWDIIIPILTAVFVFVIVCIVLSILDIM